MSCKSAINTVNQTSQTIETTAGTFVQIPFGGAVRRFGSNVFSDGVNILCCESGYFDVDCGVVLTPTAAGEVNLQIMQDGQLVPGARATFTGTAGTTVTIHIPPAMVRNCGRDCNSVLTLWIDNSATVTNVSTVVSKE